MVWKSKSHRNSKCQVVTLPSAIIVQWKMGLSNISFRSCGVIFHWNMIVGGRVSIIHQHQPQQENSRGSAYLAATHWSKGHADRSLILTCKAWPSVGFHSPFMSLPNCQAFWWNRHLHVQNGNELLKQKLQFIKMSCKSMVFLFIPPVKDIHKFVDQVTWSCHPSPNVPRCLEDPIITGGWDAKKTSEPRKKKTAGYFTSNTGCFVGILMSWLNEIIPT